ncbi:endonuclease/exonuclease/phosphatase family protein [Marinomonas colpomeniae]|uniref:Endonuclease/exonuclease/phosphatase family protein n=1 Tax=Marinomonas colpomeniae TaxID=2774408 RepID=A0ABR8P146_9GAMM|nr:endonuclease/exonuclease/phosphatase family protein [Marinomonas colpomeniae]MBD5771489.1 endonuclease/exonuclease/phosphatase family protein [Marinomonas colpomeniae]
MQLVLVFCTLIIVLVTVLPLSKNQHWIVRGMDFPRLQIAIVSATALIAHFIFLDIQMISNWVIIGVTIACLIWQLWWILPYTCIWPKEVRAARDTSPEKQLSILTSNVLTPNRNADSLIKLVKKHKPDVLVTLESDQWWEDKLIVLEETMPYSIKCPLSNLYGMHVFSKLPLENQEISYLVEKDVPSIHASLILRTGDKVRVHFIHPAPPSPTENEESAERDAELMIVARSVVDSDQPVIVTGDLNDVAWSTTTRLFHKISGLLDPRVGRGMYNTFHAKYFFLRWPLDHLFHSQHFTLQSLQRLPSIGSDHFALLTRLVFSPEEGSDQKGLTSDAFDYDRSKEMTEKKGVSKSEVPCPGE